MFYTLPLCKSHFFFRKIIISAILMVTGNNNMSKTDVAHYAARDGYGMELAKKFTEMFGGCAFVIKPVLNVIVIKFVFK